MRLLGATILNGQSGGPAGWGHGIIGQGTAQVARTVSFVIMAVNIGPTIVAATLPMPAIASVAIPWPGQGTALRVTTEPGDLAAIFVSLPGPRTLLPFFADPSWQDLTTMIPLGSGLANASGAFTIPVTMPSLSPFVFVSQGVALGPMTGFAITNPSFTTLP